MAGDEVAPDDPSALAALLLRLGSARPERFGVVQSAGNGGLFDFSNPELIEIMGQVFSKENLVKR